MCIFFKWPLMLDWLDYFMHKVYIATNIARTQLIGTAPSIPLVYLLR